MAARPYYGAAGYIRTEEASKEDGEGRKRKVGTRRTVDYGCTNVKWVLDRLCQRSAYDEKPMRPALNEVINVFNPSTESALTSDAACFGIPNESLHISDNQVRSYVNQ
jgi:hypothetical protein